MNFSDKEYLSDNDVDADYTLRYNNGGQTHRQFMDLHPLVDKRRKILMFWTPKAGCTTAKSLFLQHMGLLPIALSYDAWVHNFCDAVSNGLNPHEDILSTFVGESLTWYVQNNEFLKIKVIRNPYLRVVSSFLVYISVHAPTDFTFRQFVRFLSHCDNCDELGHHVAFHCCPQYSFAVDPLIDKYVRLESIEQDLQNVDACAHTNFLDAYRVIMESGHHHIRERDSSHTDFAGDRKASEFVNNAMPDYQYFYDQEMKTLVDNIYYYDIVEYGYEFPFPHVL